MSGCAELVVKEVDYADSRIVPDYAHPIPIKFSKMRFLLPPGTEIGLESGIGPWILGGICSFGNYPVGRKAVRGLTEQKYVKQTFADSLEANGYDVVDNINIDFRPEDEVDRAEYFISARVTDIDLDLCRRGRINVFNIFKSAESAKGKMYGRFEWSVYDALRRTVVYKTVTEGYSRRDIPNVEGLEVLFYDVFEMASHNLAADEDFYNLIVEGKKPPKHKMPRNHFKKRFKDRPRLYNPQEKVDIKNKPISVQPVPKHIKKIRDAAVMVQKNGHGSGFFITKEGHILTNQHVVGDAQRMRIVTRGKKHKLIAEVLRRDKVRDVALLKLEEIPRGLKIKPLPIRTDKLTVSEDVYAIGTPIDDKILQDTITKGIVSAHRLYKNDGVRIPYIQADVSTSGGNSGGPLVDEYGNVVGISVSGLYLHSWKRSADLNLFIPISEALRVLDITLDGREMDIYAYRDDEKEGEDKDEYRETPYFPEPYIPPENRKR